MSVSAAETSLVALDARQVPAAAAVGARQRTFVYAFTLLYAAVFVAASAVNYVFFVEPRFDLGNMVQVVWSTAHGHFLHLSNEQGADVFRLGSHFDPFLALFAPFWWAWSSPLLLLVAQAVAVASGALPVYWLARKHLASGGFAVVFAVAYLLYPPTQFNVSSPIGVHAVSFAIPLLLYAIWFLDENRLIPFAVCAVLAATTKEEIAAAVGGLGLWYAVRRGRRRTGLVVFGLGVTLSFAILAVVIPHLAPDGAQPFADRYSDVGGTPTGILHTVLSDPAAIVHQVATAHKLAFLLLVFVPFLGLWAREPLMLAGAVPDLVVNLLSARPEQTTIYYQYTAGITPFVVAASILGAARLRRRRFAAPALLAAVGCLAGVSPLIHTVSSMHIRSHAELTATRTAVDLIPPGVAVSATNSLGAYVSTRRSVATFPDLGHARWVLVGPITPSEDPVPFRRTILRLRASANWTTVFNSPKVAVFERRRSRTSHGGAS